MKNPQNLGKETRRYWTREEQILAFALYCKTPSSKINAKSNKEIQELAAIIERSDSSVVLKLWNFASLDPSLRQRNLSGMKNVSKADKQIWDEFHGNWEELAWRSEQILADRKGIDIVVSAEIDMAGATEGIERDSTIRARVNQSFFRKSVLASYNNRCCVTGITVPELLIASHIVPWALDAKNRLNPRNGLCLNALHDRAFDVGLITVTPDLKIKVSDLIKEQDGSKEVVSMFLPFDRQSIHTPRKFYPSPEFLEYHNSNIFRS